MIVAVSIRVERVTMCDSPACHLRNLWPGDRVGAAWFKRLRGPPATVNAHPLMVRATNALFHSSPLCGSAATLGACSSTTQRKNMIPRRVPARRMCFAMAIDTAAAIKPAAVKYTQNKCAIPLVPIMRIGGHPGRMQQHYPKKEHDPQKGPRQAHVLRDGDRYRGGDKAGGGKVYPEPMPRNPGRDKSGNEPGHQKMVDAKDCHGDGNEKATRRSEFVRGGVPSCKARMLQRQGGRQHQRPTAHRESLKCTGPLAHIVQDRHDTGRAANQHA